MMDLKVIAYSKTDIKEEDRCSVADAKRLLDKYETVWLDFDGKLDQKTCDLLNENFNIHPLALEDCMDEKQRSKVEAYDDFLIIILKSVDIHEDEVITQRYNIFLGKKFVITITEKESRLLETIRERIRKKKPQILKLGSDHLCYVIVDAIVDSFFPLLEQIGETIEELGIARKDVEVLGKLGTLVSPGGTLVEAYVGKLLVADLASLDYDRNEVEELIKVPFSFFMGTPPETYVLTVETHPYGVKDGARVAFPAKELGLPEMYHQAWRGRDRLVYLYRYGERVIWGIAGEIVYETVRRFREVIGKIS